MQFLFDKAIINLSLVVFNMKDIIRDNLLRLHCLLFFQSLSYDIQFHASPLYCVLLLIGTSTSKNLLGNQRSVGVVSFGECGLRAIEVTNNFLISHASLSIWIELGTIHLAHSVSWIILIMTAIERCLPRSLSHCLLHLLHDCLIYFDYIPIK